MTRKLPATRNSKVTGITHNGPHPVQPVLFLSVPALGGWALRIAVVLIAVLGGLSIAAYRGVFQRRA